MSKKKTSEIFTEVAKRLQVEENVIKALLDGEEFDNEFDRVEAILEQKEHLVRAVFKHFGLLLAEELTDGKVITVNGFGRFFLVERTHRGELQQRVKFRASKKLRDLVNGRI